MVLPQDPSTDPKILVLAAFEGAIGGSRSLVEAQCPGEWWTKLEGECDTLQQNELQAMARTSQSRCEEALGACVTRELTEPGLRNLGAENGF